MRAALALFVLVAASAVAAEPYVVLLDWTDGAFAAGGPVALDGVNAVDLPFVIDACHRDILVDLLYAPDNASVAAPGVGSVTVPFTFRAQLVRNATVLASSNIAEPGYGTPVGTAPAEGEHLLRLHMRQGLAVSWSLRVRGHAVFGEVACLPRVVVNEVEANPSGPDAGKEWVELLNTDASDAVDLSLWTLVSTHGATSSLTLPDGLVLAPGERVVVTFAAGQFLDNKNESVELRDAFGALRDATSPRVDHANDARTWQRSPDGSDAWAFASGTPDAPNG